MNVLDAFIIILIVLGIWKGWRSGFFIFVASLIGFIFGFIIAGALYSSLGSYLAPHLGSSPTMANVFAFILLWVAVPIVLGIIATTLSKAMKGVHLGGLNSLGGACIAFLQYAILISCLVNIMSFIHVIDDQKQQDESLLYVPAKGRSEERRVGKECRSRWSPY